MSEMLILMYIIQHQFTTCQLSTGTEEAMLDEKWLPQCWESFSLLPFVSLYWSSNTKTLFLKTDATHLNSELWWLFQGLRMWYCTPAVQTGSYSRPVHLRRENSSMKLIHLTTHEDSATSSSMLRIPHNKLMLFIPTLLPDNNHRSLANTRNLLIQMNR